MATNEDEFVPMASLNRIFRLWWVIVVLAVIGGITGFIIHRSRPPLYEAQAIFMGTIDLNKVDLENPPKGTPAPYEFTQYDEDITLNLVLASLRQVVPQVVDFAQQNGLQVNADELQAASTIEREHAFWMVRFRDPNPGLAQKIVNYWAQQAYADLLARQKAGQMPTYFIFELNQLADLPKSPVYYQTNMFVFAGALIGLLAGVLLVNLPILPSAGNK